MKKSRFLKGGPPPALMLTSLLDMFTIILIFLIVSFEAEAYEFKLNPELQLPESSSDNQLKPAVNVAITKQGVLVDDELAVRFVDGKASSAALTGDAIPELVEVLKKEFQQRYGDGQVVPDGEMEGGEPILVVQSDHKLDYATLYAVLRSAATAGFFKYRLAVLRT